MRHKLIMLFMFALMAFSQQALALPLLTLTPIDETYHDPAVALGTSLSVSYSITNNTPVTLTNIQASHLPHGVSSSRCESLAPKSSCTLNLSIPTDVVGEIRGRFTVCTHDSVGCTQVSADHQLNIQVLDNHTFLALTDIHVQSSLTGPINYGQDTGTELWSSALNELSVLITQQNPKFILLLGDLPAHFDILGRLTNMATALTGISGLTAISNLSMPVFYAYGNNDSLVQNYGPFFNGTTNLFFLDPAHNSPQTKGWPALNANPDCSESALQACTYTTTTPMPVEHATDMANAQTFCYYSAYPLGSATPLRLIVLNSVIFSRNYRGASQLSVAQAEMDWLSNQLAAAEANDEAVYIAMHIPVGTSPLEGGIDLWNDTLLLNDGLKFRDAFLGLISQYKNSIRGTITGHTHFDEFRALYADTALTNLIGLDIGVPAISPIFGTNPAMEVFLYDQTYTLTEKKIVYTTPSPSNWVRYSFQQDYDCPAGSSLFGCVQTNLLAQLPAWKLLPQPIPGNPYEINFAVRSPVFDPTINGVSSWIEILDTIPTPPTA